MATWTCLTYLAARVAISAVLLAASGQLWAQSLDQKAWNAVWDKLTSRLENKSDYESVHVLKDLVAATWVESNLESSTELLNLASALPEPIFSVAPSVMKDRLHDVYTRAVLDVDLPFENEGKRKAYQTARNEFDAAFRAFQDRRKDYDDLWRKRREDLKASNEKVNTRAYQRFVEENAGFFTKTRGDMEDAMRKLHQFAPVSEVWASAVTRLRALTIDMKVATPGLFPYEGSQATLESIMEECKDDDPKGWETIVFDSSINAQQNRSSKWNANGGWDGSFFKLNAGGGGGSYQSLISKANEHVSLRFCNLRVITLRPGSWFEPSLLRAIHEGKLKLKNGSEFAGTPLLGPNGKVQRVVKGAIVARSVQFVARLDESKLKEVKSSSGSSGGLSIGPFRIGGGKGGSEFSRELKTASGEYGRSTNSKVPVVLAIITEEVK